MRIVTLLLTVLLASQILAPIHAQTTGFYNGTEGKDGLELKDFLHHLINNHQPYSYYSTKDMMKYSDRDPDHPGNVLLVYTGTSHPDDDYGTGNNQLNREHVWAKSHGSFTDWLPMYSDVHNLKPCDASVNNDKGNKDFDEGGTAHLEAIGCYYTTYTWEPRDSEKGDIARIIFYMAVRYEGDNGEADLEVVDEINTSPAPEHGRLSALLEWNLQDPPDAFEMNRNEVISAWQKNRNPFIDHPEFAQLIWGAETASPLMIGDIQAYPEIPEENQEVIINAAISGSSQTLTATVYWGLSRYELIHSLPMEVISGHYIGEITGQPEGTLVFYRLEATDGTLKTSSPTYSYQVKNKFDGAITSIYDIQGQQDGSPLVSQQVTATGVVTATFGEYYYLQQGRAPWSGIRVWDPGRSQNPGDSVIITGTVMENQGVTEISDVVYHYPLKKGTTAPAPIQVTCSDIDESYEGMLITVQTAECTEADYYNNDWMWTVQDGTGYLKVYNTAIFEYQPLEGEQYTVTGPLNHSGSSWYIELRSESDVQHVVDLTPPTIETVEVINTSTIRIQFSETPDPFSAETEANYKINNGVSVLDANQQVNMKRNIYLNVSNLQNGAYELKVENVRDLGGNVMVPSIHTFSVTNGIPGRDGLAGLSVWYDSHQRKVYMEWHASPWSAVHYFLTDSRGQLVRSGIQEPGPGIHTMGLEAAGLGRGCYFLTVYTSDNSCTWKMIFL
ncbi:MAG TPA: endonuclease [Bacteroidales bacterium]|nr:endonuclease [Bacteroidales bacterium]